jgi:hypothetical protein
MTATIHRREALVRFLTIAGASAFPGALLACNSKPSCNDVSGLSTDDITARSDARYLDKAADATKTCATCVQFQPKPQGGCGGCKVLKGPVSPEGGCKLWASRTD